MVLNTDWAQVEVIDLINDGSGLAFGIIGGRSTGVVVKTIVPGGVADKDGRLQSGDHILQIGEVNLRGLGSEQVASVLRQCGVHVRMVVARPVESTSGDYHSLGSHAPIVPTKILGDPVELDKHLNENGYSESYSAHPSNVYTTPYIYTGQQTDVQLHTISGLVDVVRNPLPIGTVPLPLQSLPPITTVNLLPLDMALRDSSQPETEIYSIELRKDELGLGITVAGYVCEKEEISGIFVKSISKGSAADITGKIKINDRIVEVNGKSVLGQNNHQSVEILRNTGNKVTMRLERYLRGPKYDQLQQAILANEFRPPSPPSPSVTSLSKIPLSLVHMSSLGIEPEGESRTSFDFDSTVLHDLEEINIGDNEIVIDTADGRISVQFSICSHDSINEKWREKLREDVEIVIAEMSKDATSGLGISLEGTVDVEDGHEVRPHHYIRNILPNGPVGINGGLLSGDELLEVNGIQLLGLNHLEVVSILKQLPSIVILVCARRAVSNTRIIDTSQHMDAFQARNILAGSLNNLIHSSEKLVKAKSDTSITSSVVSENCCSMGSRSRSLELVAGLPMWSDVPTVVLLKKADHGLGFSILDYQDPLNPQDTVIVIRSLIPGGVAQTDAHLIPGDRLIAVNDIDVEHVTLDRAVQVLKGAPKGTVKITVYKPLSSTDVLSHHSQDTEDDQTCIDDFQECIEEYQECLEVVQICIEEDHSFNPSPCLSQVEDFGVHKNQKNLENNNQTNHKILDDSEAELSYKSLCDINSTKLENHIQALSNGVQKLIKTDSIQSDKKTAEDCSEKDGYDTCLDDSFSDEIAKVEVIEDKTPTNSIENLAQIDETKRLDNAQNNINNRSDIYVDINHLSKEIEEQTLELNKQQLELEMAQVNQELKQITKKRSSLKKYDQNKELAEDICTTSLIEYVEVHDSRTRTSIEDEEKETIIIKEIDCTDIEPVEEALMLKEQELVLELLKADVVDASNEAKKDCTLAIFDGDKVIKVKTTDSLEELLKTSEEIMILKNDITLKPIDNIELKDIKKADTSNFLSENQFLKKKLTFTNSEPCLHSDNLEFSKRNHICLDNNPDNEELNSYDNSSHLTRDDEFFLLQYPEELTEKCYSEPNVLERLNTPVTTIRYRIAEYYNDIEDCLESFREAELEKSESEAIDVSGVIEDIEELEEDEDIDNFRRYESIINNAIAKEFEISNIIEDVEFNYADDDEEIVIKDENEQMDTIGIDTHIDHDVEYQKNDAIIAIGNNLMDLNEINIEPSPIYNIAINDEPIELIDLLISDCSDNLKINDDNDVPTILNKAEIKYDVSFAKNDISNILKSDMAENVIVNKPNIITNTYDETKDDEVDSEAEIMIGPPILMKGHPISIMDHLIPIIGHPIPMITVEPLNDAKEDGVVHPPVGYKTADQHMFDDVVPVKRRSAPDILDNTFVTLTYDPGPDSNGRRKSSYEFKNKSDIASMTVTPQLDVVTPVSVRDTEIMKMMEKHWGPIKIVTISREPNCSLGISIVGGKVDLYHESAAETILGIFIKTVVPNSPAGKNGELKTGDRILDVSGVSLRNVSHEKAVDIIKYAKNPIIFMVQSLLPYSNSAHKDTEILNCASPFPSPDHTSATNDVSAPKKLDYTSSKKSVEFDKEVIVNHIATTPRQKTVESSEESDDDVDERDTSGRTVSAKGQDIDRASAANLRRTKEEIALDTEEEDDFGYTTNKVKKKYANLGQGQSHSILMVQLERSGQGLGLSLAGHKDRSCMAVFVCGINPTGAAHRIGGVHVGDEILEVNGVVLHGRCHLNASAIIKGLSGPIFKVIILRRKAAIDDIAVRPITQFPVSLAEEASEEAFSNYPNVRTVSIKKGTQSLGIMIIEGKHADVGQGIFISDIQEGSSAEKAGLEIGEMILAVNKDSLLGSNYDTAANLLKRTEGLVTLVVSNPGKRSSSPVPDGDKNCLKAGSAISRPTTPIPEPPADPSSCAIAPGRDTTIEIASDNKALGIYFVGGKDTLISGIIVVEVYPGGAADKDARLQPGDQIMDVNGTSFKEITHNSASQSLRQTLPKMKLIIYRLETPDFQPIDVDFVKKPGKGLGLSIVVRKSGKGTYVSEILNGGCADVDGKILKGDLLFSINGQNVESSTGDEVGAILKTVTGKVTLKLHRYKPITR